MRGEAGGAKAQDTVILSCLSHFGDYNAWEMTQQYMTAVKSGRLSEERYVNRGVRVDDFCTPLLAHHYIFSPVVLVGIGSVEAAKTFAADIGLSSDPSLKDRIILVTDETGSVTEALDCYRGWLTVDKKHKERYPFTDVNPVIKLLGMIFGFGSPGTMGKVLEGYTGDVAENYGLFGRQWVIQALTQGGEKGRFPQVDVSLDTATKLQPFELATLRLQTGLHIVAKWSKLGPKDGDLFTRMGGTFVFLNKKCLFEHFDLGILNFANMDDICLVAESAVKGQQYIPPSNKSQARKNRQNFWARKDEDAKRQIQENMRRAEEARREERRRAKEAKRAEEARLAELDRIEAERIAEVARQGEAAKKARQAEIEAKQEAERLEAEKAAVMAKQAEEAEKVRKFQIEAQKKIERLEAERKAKEVQQVEEQKASVLKFESDTAAPARIENDHLEASVDEILMRAEEQEKKIRESLEAIQNVKKSSTSNAVPEVAATKDQEECSQRNLPAAKIEFDQSTQKPVNGDSIAVAAEAKKVENGSEVTISSTLSSKQREEFQRELLAARIQFDKPTANGKSQSDVTISMTNSVHGIANGAQKNGSTNGSKNGSTNDLTNGSSKRRDEQEMFQRNLLASRYKYEGSNGANGKSDSKPETSTMTSLVTPDDALL